MPVTFKRDLDIDAPAEQVWAILTDPATWPEWFPDMDEVLDLASVETGNSFRWREGDNVGRGTISSVDVDANRLKVLTQGDSSPVTHTFDVNRAGGVLGFGGRTASLTDTMEYDPPGGAITDFLVGGNPMDQFKVKRTLDKVSALARMLG